MPQIAQFHQPAEWAPHTSTWVAWPSHAELWKENLEPAQAEFTGLCEGILAGEDLNVLVPSREARERAEAALKPIAARLGHSVQFHDIPFGDIWVRDTAPIFLIKKTDQSLASVRFAFNGWGEKYALPHDSDVSKRVAQTASAPSQFSYPWILEGGSVEVDGEGTCLTTRQCLLNENRNPGMTEAQIEAGLKEALGVSKVLWLGDGLLNDHTDGHIDTIARFVAPGVALCMEARGKNDPNEEVMNEIARDLEAMTDAKGRKLKVVRVPSPGRIENEFGDVMPASYVNFYIANSTVIVPTYGSPFDAAAVKEIGALFPERKTIGVSAFSILSGGGAFHCITQQQPAGTSL